MSRLHRKVLVWFAAERDRNCCIGSLYLTASTSVLSGSLSPCFTYNASLKVLERLYHANNCKLTRCSQRGLMMERRRFPARKRLCTGKYLNYSLTRL